MNFSQGPLSVSQLLKQVKGTLEKRYSQICVIGEISNISKSATGHLYFNISDNFASMSCAFFKNDYANLLRLDHSLANLKKGDRVVCKGPISLYLQRGSFQLIVKTIEIDGEGDLQKKFEKLKSKLAGDGIFDLENKYKIPTFAKKIGVITSLHGAALKDFINIYKRRSPWCDILVLPALVQGDTAAKSIQNSVINAIKFNLSDDNKNKIDVLVLTRGGGSDEDLWCFNDEALAWEIYNCPIPTVSAVGHERDFTICDFVCDFRCETPSSAAEMLSQQGFSINTNLKNINSKLKAKIENDLYRYKESLLRCRPDRLYYKLNENFMSLNNKLIKLNVFGNADRLMQLNDKSFLLEDLLSSIDISLKSKIQKYSNELNSQRDLLEVLNPNSILKRGYSLTLDSNGKIIKSQKYFNQIDKGSSLKIKFQDGIGNVQKK